MSEEVDAVELQALEVAPEASEAPSIEEIARKKGWKPPEEAIKKGLDPKDAVDAKTYLDRDPFIKQIKTLDQRNKTMAKKIDQILAKFDEAEKVGYEKALADLEARKIEAYQDRDLHRAKQIEAEIHKNTAKIDQISHRQPDVPPEAVQFMENNKDWFKKDEDATMYASVKEQEYLLKYPGMDLSELYEMVQKDVNEFRGVETEVEKPRAKKRSNVASPTRSSSTSKESDSYSVHDLRPDAKDLYMSMKNYYKDEFKKEYSVNDFVKSQLSAGAVSREELLDE